MLRPLCVLAAALALPACGGPRNFENDNDRLRAENLQLQRQLQQAEELAALRASELEATRAQLDGDATPAVEGATPVRLARIALDRYGSAIDTDNDGRDDLARVYVKTLDNRGRFVPVAGRATLQIVHIREGEEPTLLAEKTYDPDAWDAAYRAGFTGTHYTLEVPLPDIPPNARDATAKVTVTDAATGNQFTEQQALKIQQP